MRFRRRFPRMIAIGFLCLLAGVLFVGAGPADGPTDGGPSAWKLPTNDVYFVSDSLEDGRYRVSTQHTVFWPTGQDAGYSVSGWLSVESN